MTHRQPVTELVERLLVRFADWTPICGVPVISAAHPAERVALAQDRLRSTLELIRDRAPEQFAQLRVHIRGIVIGPLREAQGSWRHRNRLCMLDEQYALADDTTPLQLACTIVHELMHARLEAKGFRSDKGRRARIERLCFLDARNFLLRSPPTDDRRRISAMLERQLSRDPAFWSDEAVRERHLTTGSKWQQALRFVFRPLPDI